MDDVRELVARHDREGRPASASLSEAIAQAPGSVSRSGRSWFSCWRWQPMQSQRPGGRRGAGKGARLVAGCQRRNRRRDARREEAEDQLRQLQKMDAIGQLTGGIAHDFNNMLAVIMSSLNLMKRRLSRGDTDIGKYLEAAMEGANRAAVLTARLLAFARQQALAPKPVDANKLLSGMSELLRRTLGPTIRIETLLTGGLWRTHADPSQLENAILNLAVNSRDAMPEGGRLTIETQNCHLDETYLTALAIPPGQYVMIAVTDTGAGMSPEVVSRAFEPFFSTKGVGKGTGLGLSQVYGFVKQSNGHVRIYSEVGQGTTVKIYLPRFLGAELADAGADALRALDLAHPGETVLVVEDDERVRRLTVDALNELGYGVHGGGRRGRGDTHAGAQSRHRSPAHRYRHAGYRRPQVGRGGSRPLSVAQGALHDGLHAQRRRPQRRAR